jgi:DNA-binding response OmpR family regulator
LAIAREIVGLHGGEIGVTSTPGSGCTFYFRLPVGCEHLDPDEIDIGTEALPDTRSPLNAPSLRLDGTHDRKTPVPRLLLVEDSFDLRAYLRILLAPAYRVLEATNGQEAWELLQHTRPDIILSDVMMPHLDGIELCRRVKAAPLLRKVPIVLLSAKALPQHRVEGLEAGADDYLAKPFSAAELLQRLHARLRVDSMPDGNSWHDKLLECIDANLGDATFHVAKLARQVGLSPRQLHRRVLAEFGLTPVSLLTERRIQRGRVLLLAGQFETVAEVAHHVGLSPGYFSRRYRARFLDG